MKKVILVILAAFLLLPACKESRKVELGSQANQNFANGPVEIQLAKLLSVTDVMKLDEVNPSDFKFNLKGKDVSFKDYIKGKNVILNFWATWCPPCKAELPNLVAISKEYKSKNWIVIGVLLEREDYSVQKTKVADFLTDKGIEYTNIIGTPEMIGKLTKAYGGVSGIPTTFFINTTGKIYNTQVGSMEKAGFEELMNIIK
ncbi:MAG: TlpA disulfide reductase family protein [bacterium]